MLMMAMAILSVPMTSKAAISDPSAYMMPAPVHETAPLADMVYVGYPDQSDSIASVPSSVMLIGEEERDMLAALVQHEAGNQDAYGKRLVVAVVFNRLNDPAFPDTITEVIYQKGQFLTAAELSKVVPTDQCYEAVDMECMQRSDTTIRFFNNSPDVYGSFAYKYGDHYFGR